MKNRITRLTSKGISHLLIPVLLFMAIGAIGGTYLTFKSHAATTDTDVITAGTSSTTINFRGELCESFGAYCANTSNFNTGTGVVGGFKGSSRTMQWEPDGGTFGFGGVNYKTGVLAFPVQTNKCAVSPYSINTFVVVDACSGVTGNIWAIGYINNHLVFISKRWTNHYGSLQVLSSTSNGSIFSAEKYGATGYFQKWDFK